MKNILRNVILITDECLNFMLSANGGSDHQNCPLPNGSISHTQKGIVKGIFGMPPFTPGTAPKRESPKKFRTNIFIDVGAKDKARSRKN